MKKTLLILAIAAGGALQASAQTTQITVLNKGFEDTTQTEDSIPGWDKAGTIKFVTSSNFTVGTQPQTQIPYDGSTRFIDIRAKKVTDTTYERGMIRQVIEIPGPSSGIKANPAYLQFVTIYAPQFQSGDRMLVRVFMTYFDFTTGLDDTIGTGGFITNTGAAFYPWTKVGVPITYENSNRPTKAHIEFWANAGATLGPNTVLHLEDIRFEDRSVLSLPEAVNSALGLQVYPNPVHTDATIAYTLPENSAVSINVYDISGRQVKTVFEGNQPKGDHTAAFERGNLKAGMYIYKLQAGNQVETGKIMIGE